MGRTAKKTTKKKATKRAVRKRTPRKAPAKKAPRKAPSRSKSIDPVSRIVESVKELRGKAGTGVRRYSDSAPGVVTEFIPTGIDVLDHYVLGCGGLPCGRASEVFSSTESAGKSSFLFHCLAQVQRAGGIAVLADNESGFDPAWASEVHGINLEQLILIEADHIESTGEEIIATVLSNPVKGGPPMLIGWDSIAATPTKAEIAGYDNDDDEKERIGDKARQLSKFCRQIVKLLKPHHAHLMFINQGRDKIGVMFGNKTTTPGGHAIKFYSSIRLDVSHGGSVKAKNEHVGKDSRFLAVKNKVAPPWRKALVRLDFQGGWDNQWATLTHAMETGILPPRSRGLANYEKAMQTLRWPIKEPDL